MKGLAKSIESFSPSQLWVKKTEGLVSRYSKVGNSVFFSKAQFPWVEELEANWQVIRQELDQVMQHMEALPNFQDISPRQQDIANDNLWKTYFFCAFGFRAQGNCDRCPETTRLLQNIPGLKVAFFFYPGSRQAHPRTSRQTQRLNSLSLGAKSTRA